MYCTILAHPLESNLIPGMVVSYNTENKSIAAIFIVFALWGTGVASLKTDEPSPFITASGSKKQTTDFSGGSGLYE